MEKPFPAFILVKATGKNNEARKSVARGLELRHLLLPDLEASSETASVLLKDSTMFRFRHTLICQILFVQIALLPPRRSFGFTLSG